MSNRHVANNSSKTKSGLFYDRSDKFRISSCNKISANVAHYSEVNSDLNYYNTGWLAQVICLLFCPDLILCCFHAKHHLISLSCTLKMNM